MRFWRRLLKDDRGGAMENVMSLSVSWYVVFGVFLMNVQLGKSYHQRDAVDHAASVAADAVTKTLCADAKDFGGAPQGEFSGARQQAVQSAVQPLFDLVGTGDVCKVDVKPKAGATSADTGQKTMDVNVSCEVPCNIPIAAQVMCKGSPAHVSFAATRTAVATGCDSGKGG